MKWATRQRHVDDNDMKNYKSEMTRVVNEPLLDCPSAGA